jgi:hypothetical protein
MISRHARRPEKPFAHYLESRLYFDCAGWSDRDHAAEPGVAWVRMGLSELPKSAILVATDYRLAVQSEDEIAVYLESLPSIVEASELLSTAAASSPIPNIEHRAPCHAAT